MFLIDELRRSIKDKRAVLIVGAGTSIAATGSPNASWKGLLRMGIERCVYVGSPRPRLGWEGVMLQLLEIGDIEDWLLIAEQVQQRLNGGELVNLLQDWNAGLQVKHTGIIRALSDLGLPIMTTNYDTVIEEVTNRKTVSLEEDQQEELLKSQGNPEDYVIHLHGCHTRPNNIVLGIRSYEKFLDDDFKRFFMNLLPAFRSVIFVGCGGGLGDPNFSALKEWIRRNRQGVSIRHYRLLAREEDSGIQPEARIVPLIYGEKHSELEAFLCGLD